MKNHELSRGAAWVLALTLAVTGLRAQDTSRPVPLETAPATPAETSSDARPTPAPASTSTSDSTPAPAAPVGSKMLRLNFRGVPLEMVLNYLSEAAGYIIVLDTEVRGKVDVWSNQPVTQDEAFTILDSVLAKNGYSAIRNGRTLTVISKDNAKRRDIPVRSGANPTEIPKTEEMVTQILPIRYINATQLIQNLTPLMSSDAVMTANEAGNALVITDSQINIRRLAEIIRALDTSMSGATVVKVFALKYADAKELATVIKELYPAQTGTQGGGGGGNNNNGGRGGFGGGFPGGGFPGGGFPGFGGAGAQGGNRTGGGATGRTGIRVTAVADEHSNSIIVNAPDDIMPDIAALIESVDTNVQDVTELRVFRLKFADPSEMADLLSNLFPDETRSNDNSRGQVRFGGGPFGFGGGNRATTGNDSERAKKKGRVLAVPDPRTSSVIVSADRDLMTQIGAMVQQLDSNPAQKQKVFVYDLENADPTQVQEVLRNLFENQTTANRNTRNQSSQSSALTTRSTQNQNNQRNTGTGFGGGTGGGGGGGGGTGGGFGRGN